MFPGAPGSPGQPKKYCSSFRSDSCLWQDCVVEAAIAYHSTTQPPRSGSHIRIMPALEPWTGTRRLLMLVEKPLPGSPPRPVPAAIGRDIFGAAPSASKRKRPWFVYRGMIDRQSGQGEETSQRREPRCIVYRASRIAPYATMRLGVGFFNRIIAFLEAWSA